MRQRTLGIVMDTGGAFHVKQFDVGTRKDEESYCRIEVKAEDAEQLRREGHIE